MADAFAAVAAQRPDAPALEIDGTALTHGALDAHAARVGGFLHERGVAADDRVLLCAPTSMDLVVAYLGILRVGATAMPCDAALTAAELAHLLEDGAPAAAFVAPAARERLAKAGDVPTVVTMDDVAALDGEPIAPEPDPGPAMLAYTSGTTGAPKGVPLTHANVLASTRGVVKAWRWSADDVLVHALPLSHQHGLSGVHLSLLCGSSAVVFSRFDPATLTGAIAEHEATVLFAVPAMYERLDAWDGIRDARLGSLRLAVSGSAPLSPALAERVQGW